jgi:DNA polymerase-1
MYEQFEQISLSDRVKKLLLEGKEMAFFSRELSTILCTVPIKFSLDDALFPETYDRDHVISLFKTLEFNSLISKLPKQEQQATSAVVEKYIPTIQLQNFNYTAIDDDKSFFAFLALLCAQKEFAFDTETTSEKPLEAELVGISFSWKEGEAFYCNFAHNIPFREQWLPHLKPLFEDESIAKYGHNLKYDASILANYGIQVSPLSFDTMLAAYLLHPGDPVGLKSLALSMAGMQLDPIETFIGSGKEQTSFATVPLEQALHYACMDADATWRLVQLLRTQLSKTQ